MHFHVIGWLLLCFQDFHINKLFSYEQTRFPARKPESRDAGFWAAHPDTPLIKIDLNNEGQCEGLRRELPVTFWIRPNFSQSGAT